jgi:hypothetical protein
VFSLPSSKERMDLLMFRLCRVVFWVPLLLGKRTEEVLIRRFPYTVRGTLSDWGTLAHLAQLRSSQSLEMLNKNCKVQVSRTYVQQVKTFWEIDVSEAWPSKSRCWYFRTECMELATCLSFICILFITSELCYHYMKCKAVFPATHQVFLRSFKIYRHAYVTMVK